MTSVARVYAHKKYTDLHKRSSDDAKRAPVVLMVSGGADSTALLVLAATSKLDICDGAGPSRIAKERLYVLHINHGLRGEDAQKDEEFVRALAARYGLLCKVVHAQVNELVKRYGNNVENAGREVRYAEAQKLANELSAQFKTPRSEARILTAHTANDRAETFFAHAISGTGTQGLSSIPRRRNRIVRPLLDMTHEELCHFLQAAGILWREDKTNEDTRYQRSYIRHEILPRLKQQNPKVIQSVGTSCEILSDEDRYLAGIASRALRLLILRSGEGVLALHAAKLAALDVAIARRVIRMAVKDVAGHASDQCRIEAQHIADVLRIVAAGTGSVNIALGIDCRVEYGALFLRMPTDDKRLQPCWLPVPGSTTPAPTLGSAPEMAERTASATQCSCVTARLLAVNPGTDPVAIAKAHAQEWGRASVLLDAQAAGVAAADAKLWVDAPQAGDIICPLGMHGQSKKLSDLLNEAKIPAAERASVPIVRTGPTGKIVWVAQVRADERFRCSATTKVLLELRFQAVE